MPIPSSLAWMSAPLSLTSAQQSVNQAGSLCVNDSSSSSSSSQPVDQEEGRVWLDQCANVWARQSQSRPWRLQPPCCTVNSTHLPPLACLHQPLSWRNKWIFSPAGDQNHLVGQEAKCQSRFRYVESSYTKWIILCPATFNINIFTEEEHDTFRQICTMINLLLIINVINGQEAWCQARMKFFLSSSLWAELHMKEENFHF